MIIFVRECFIMEEKVSFFREIDFTKISSEFRKFKKKNNIRSSFKSLNDCNLFDGLK